MKIKPLIILLLIFFGVQSFAQMKNTIVVDPVTKEKYLMGYCDLNGLKKGVFGAYFNSQLDVYEPSNSLINKLSGKIDDYEITLVLGTWCIDSKREVPRLYKVLSEAGYNLKRIQVIAVNRDKQAVVVNINDLNIESVPTIILYKNEEEVGRIVEIPKRSMEANLWRIIK